MEYIIVKNKETGLKSSIPKQSFNHKYFTKIENTKPVEIVKEAPVHPKIKKDESKVTPTEPVQPTEDVKEEKTDPIALAILAYEKKYNKEPANRYKNDLKWLLSKI